MSEIKLLRGSSASFLDEAYDASLDGNLYGWLFDEAPAGHVDFQTATVYGGLFVRGRVWTECHDGKAIRRVSVDLLPKETRAWYWHWVTHEQDNREKERAKDEEERVRRVRRYRREYALQTDA